MIGEEPGGGSGLFKDFPEVLFHLDKPLLVFFRIFLVMKEIASFSVGAASVSEEAHALFSFVSAIGLSAAAQFVGSVCEFAFIFIGTPSKLHKLFAELGFFFIPSWVVLDESILGALAGRTHLAVLFDVVVVSQSFHNLERHCKIL